jgi:hypothetical protein
MSYSALRPVAGHEPKTRSSFATACAGVMSPATTSFTLRGS